MSKTPITLITGFLGSGKTTLLRELLTDPALGETAVLVNELGEIALDHHLLSRIDERTVVLASGCVCCTIRADLADELRELEARRARGEIPGYERVAIETTGLADPAPILSTLLTDPMVEAHYRIDAIVTTVDAVNGVSQLRGQAEAAKQAAVADRLLLTKTDLVDPEQVAELRRRLTRINPGARQIVVSHGRLPASEVIGAAARDDAEMLRDALRFSEAVSAQDEGGHVHEHSAHDHRIRAFALRFEQPLDWTMFGIWLSMLLAARGEDVLRVKGLLNAAGSEGPVVINGVQHVVHPPVHLAAWPDDDRSSRLVLIVREIAAEAVERSLLAFQELASLSAGAAAGSIGASNV
jgi:G3E family GTPase